MFKFGGGGGLRILPNALELVQHPGDIMEESKLLHFFLPVELLFRVLHHRAWTGIILPSEGGHLVLACPDPEDGLAMISSPSQLIWVKISF